MSRMPSLSRTGTSPRRAALLALAGLVAALLPAGPALAGAGGTDPDRRVRQVGDCRAYGSSSGFGIACAGPGGASGPPLTSFLPPEGLAECWVEEPLEGVAFPPRTGPGEWFLQTCVDGIDLRTLQPDPGLRVTQTYRFLRPGEGHVLTEGERTVVDALLSSGQVPLPFPELDITPSVVPRVGELVAFSVVGPAETVRLEVGGVSLQGRLQRLEVEPEGDGGPVVRCTGRGRAITPAEAERADRTGEDDLGEDVCAYRYGRSSFRAGDGDRDGDDADRYPVEVTAWWDVVFGDGQLLGSFGKEAVNEVRVAEVQTLVVTGSGR